MDDLNHPSAHHSISAPVTLDNTKVIRTWDIEVAEKFEPKAGWD